MISTEEIERVNSIITIQNDIIVSYKLYFDYVENNEQQLAKYMKFQIEELEKNLNKIRVRKLASILINE